jgi:hypothetical protein
MMISCVIYGLIEEGKKKETKGEMRKGSVPALLFGYV